MPVVMFFNFSNFSTFGSLQRSMFKENIYLDIDNQKGSPKIFDDEKEGEKKNKTIGIRSKRKTSCTN